MVDVAKYLRERKQRVAEQAEAVKDFKVFDFDHVPEQPLLRDEARLLIDDILRFDVSGIPTHYAIIGSRGSGKTLTLKYLQRVIPEQTELDVLYANCRDHNTSFKVLAHLLGVRARGVNLAELFAAELFAAFCKRCERKTVVVLDEIDLMSPKDPRREILYLLSRAEQPFMVLTLANNPHVLKQLDPATRSSLQPVPLHFRDYDATQITEILRDRAERGLTRWEQGQLAEIAALTVRRTQADARVAIKTLFYSVTRSQESMTECFERARRDIVVDIITNLSIQMLLVLWAVETSATDFVKPIYSRFCQTHGEKPFSYMHFYTGPSYLQSVGLVALLATKVGRAYTNRVLLNFDRPIVRQVCQL